MVKLTIGCEQYGQMKMFGSGKFDTSQRTANICPTRCIRSHMSGQRFGWL